METFNEFNEDKSVASIKSVLNGDKHGTNITVNYELDKTIVQQDNYNCGNLTNSIKTENGYITCEEDFRNNKRTGVFRKFDKDGLLIEEITYKNGLKNGECLTFHSNGNVKTRETYVNNKLDESLSSYEYHENGRIKVEKKWVNLLSCDDVSCLNFYEWDETGKLINYFVNQKDNNIPYSLTTEENDISLKVTKKYNNKTFTEDIYNKTLKESIITKGCVGKFGEDQYISKHIYSEGYLIHEIYYDKDSERHLKYYKSDDKQLKMKYTVVNNNLNGKYLEYDVDGNLTRDTYYHNGIEDKYYCEKQELKDDAIGLIYLSSVVALLIGVTNLVYRLGARS
uniref:Uncharacterized protein n=1 Tax=viral metagenome TaxID=1070528 RepID=A0A6C0E9G1_9ZZZZ